MHKYLRAIGFSELSNRKQLNELLKDVILKADEKQYFSADSNYIFAEYNHFYSANMGISVRGEFDDEDKFIVEYYYPFFRGSRVSSYEDVSVERHAEKESYAGICDDIKIGVSMIFYLQNIIPYLKYETLSLLPVQGTSLVLSALSTSGTIMMPIKKDEVDKKKTKQAAITRNKLIAAARKGDEEAIENLTLEDMDTYSSISRKILKEDIFTLVDTYFMPYGVECDQYSILGEIEDYKLVENQITKEIIYEMTINCNEMYMDICINKSDVMGEPEIGRRFKGTIWLQGWIHYPQDSRDDVKE